MQMLAAISNGSIDMFVASLTTALLLLLICFPVHEMAHAYAARALGDHTAERLGRLTLNPLAHLDPIGSVLFLVTGFGWAKPVPVNVYRLNGRTRTSFALVALAGPASNVVMAVIFGLAFRVFSPVLAGTDSFLSSLLEWALLEAVILNLTLALFNLVPVPPLDGSRLLAALLPEQASQVVDQLERYGFLILALILVAAPSLLNGLVAQPALALTRLLTGY